MKKLSPEVVIRLACILALVALGLIAWSLVDPRPIPVILAMSLGQMIGTLSFVAFLGVVVLDLRSAERRSESRKKPLP